VVAADGPLIILLSQRHMAQLLQRVTGVRDQFAQKNLRKLFKCQ
jgi:hypothetical protein